MVGNSSSSDLWSGYIHTDHRLVANCKPVEWSFRDVTLELNISYSGHKSVV